MSTALDQREYQATAAPHEGRPSRSIYITCAIVFLLAFAVRIGVLVHLLSYAQETSELMHVAKSLAHGHGFADAYKNGAPTAHVSPLYPLLLSLMYRVFGTGMNGRIAQEVLASCFAALTWALLPVLAGVCGLARRVGFTAGVAGAVMVLYPHSERGLFEADIAGLATLLLFTVYMRCWYTRDFSVRTAVLTGIASGVAMLISASLGAIVASLLVAGYFVFRKELGIRYLRFSLVAAAVIVATLFPWALRNRLVLGGWVWTRSNLPLELRVSNDDEATPMTQDNWAPYLKYHPTLSPEKRALALKIGELAFQQRTKNEVLLWIRTHPKRFAWLTLQRMFYFWFPAMKRPFQTILMALLFLASIPALVLLLREKQPLGYALLTIWIAYPLVYYLLQVDPRYLHPIQWSKYLLIAYGVWVAFRRREVSGFFADPRPLESVQ